MDVPEYGDAAIQKHSSLQECNFAASKKFLCRLGINQVIQTSQAARAEKQNLLVIGPHRGMQLRDWRKVREEQSSPRLLSNVSTGLDAEKLSSEDLAIKESLIREFHSRMCRLHRWIKDDYRNLDCNNVDYWGNLGKDALEIFEETVAPSLKESRTLSRHPSRTVAKDTRGQTDNRAGRVKSQLERTNYSMNRQYNSRRWPNE
ncbi:hypothetical protein WN51_02163 [Melipona quadrifasciata]|uniref:Uncharacterized protein n=1 Tax=Melipona quadrifasciata TaxID=166423 RepID=A0A0M8ZW40_9HYME|nr:hypothetical protein WN51_02163 [Melipona quadrifasciata]